MLPKPLYESLPFICLILGGVITMLGDGSLLFLAGLGLFFGGAAIRIMRSHHRRLDARINNREQQKMRYSSWTLGSSMPEPLYETLPYLYMVLGFILFRFNSEIILQVLSVIFICLGFSVLFVRRRSRLSKAHSESHIES